MGIEKTILWMISKLSQLHWLNHFMKSQAGQLFSYLKLMRLNIFSMHRLIFVSIDSVWIVKYTVMSILEAPCAKTTWRALLFRAIFVITGALLVCFDIWRFKQPQNNEAGSGGHHRDFEQHVPCVTVHVCMNPVKFLLEAPGASILWGRYYSVTMCRLTWGLGLLLGRALLIGTLRYFQ